MDDFASKGEAYADRMAQLREKRPLKTFSSGETYEGEWIGENKDGYGTLVWADGRKCEGKMLRKHAFS